MKKVFTTLAIVLVAFAVQAQSNFGIGTNTPSASAALDVTSTSQGILVPRMTTTARNAISSPAKGLMVYDSTLNNFYYHNGTAWTAVGSSNSSSTYPNVELSTTNTSQQMVSNLFGQGSFNTLSLSGTNGTNATLTGNNTWNGTTFTVGNGGAGWYQITGNFLGVTSGSNGATTIGYQVVLDKNNSFTAAPTSGTYPLAFSTYNSSVSSSLLKNLSTIQAVVYLAAGDYLNFRAQSWSTSTAAYTSTDGSSNLQIVRLK